MRSDYALYMVAIILFAITIIFLAYEIEYKQLLVVTTAVFGFLFIGLGYAVRPKPRVSTIETPPPPSAAQTTTEVAKEEPAPVPVVEVAPPKKTLIDVKGVKEKRAEQLRALGINTVEELANASAEDLGRKLKISPKITITWIENAKKLLE